MTARDALSPKHRKFLDEYCKDRNGAAAVRRSGYSERRAKVTAAELLARDDIKAALADVDADNHEHAGITEKRIIDELAKLGFANMADYMRVGADGDPYLDFSRLSRDQAAALVEVTVEDFKEGRGKDARDVRRVKFKLADKKGALVDLGKHLGMFKERVEHTGKDGGPIELRKVHELTDEQLAAIASAGSGRALAAPEGESKPARLRKRRSNPGKAG